MSYSPIGVRITNKSHKPGCSRRSPASYACHARVEACISTAACGWVRPQADRRCLIASGVGVIAARGALRLGWLGIDLKTNTTIRSHPTDNCARNQCFFGCVAFDNDVPILSSPLARLRKGVEANDRADSAVLLNTLGSKHFDSLAPETRGAVSSEFAAHDCIVSHNVRYDKP